MWRNWEATRKIALRYVIVYILISVIYVLISDLLLETYTQNLPKWTATVKGWIFILISSFLCYNLIQNGIKATLETEAKYRLIVENVSDLIAVIDRAGTYEYISPSHQNIMGFSANDFIGRKIYDFIPNGEISEMQECLRQLLLGGQGQGCPVRFNLRHKNGRFVLVEIKGVPILGGDGVVGKIIIFAQDISEHEQAVIQLMESEERYRKLVEYSPETTFIHKNGIIVYINNAGLELVGAKAISQIIGKSVLDFVPLDNLENVRSRMKKVQVEGKSEMGESQIIRLDGTPLFVEMLAFQTNFQGEKAVQVIIRDISVRKKAEEQVNYLAYYDTLTRLPNRNSLNNYLEGTILDIRESDGKLAVMFLDLDRFKMINDTFGHSFGDLLLQHVTKRINSGLQGGGMLFRYSGDEFIIIRKYNDINEVTQLVEQIIESLSRPFFIQSRQTYITTSVGISIYPRNGKSVEELIKTSDTAMYWAKENGRSKYQFYTESLDTTNLRKMEIGNGLRNAIINDEFTLNYQPQVDLMTNQIIGLEALIRWEHPEYGNISPTEFIPVAEETGLIVPIGKWVIETACKQSKLWQEAGIPPICIAVNVSPLQFQEKCFVKTVEKVLSDTMLEACLLELEITESVMQNVEETISIMGELKSLGVLLSVDDFGTGFSSLNYLRHFPIDKLKIDKSFIDEIKDNLNGEVIVKIIIELGNSIGYKVIAEGIEEVQQVKFLKENSCYFGQGYLFSKPLRPIEIEKNLKGNRILGRVTCP